jgi:sugar-specific transcriptional regulator TrmB
MTSKIISALQILGISHRASLVFDQFYSNQQLSITELAKLTGLHRAQIYEALEELVTQDLASRSDKTKCKILVVMPQIILSRIQSQESRIQKTVTNFIDDFPIILSKYNQIESSTVLKLKQGKNQLVRQFVEAYKDLHDEVLFIGNEKTYIDLLGFDVLATFSEYRHQQKIPMRVLATENRINSHDEELNRKVKKLENFNLPFALQIIDNKVFFWDSQLEQLIIVDDQNMSKFWRVMFEYLWNSVKSPQTFQH